MKRLTIAKPFLTVLPALAIVPVFIGIIHGFHAGGMDIVYRFFTASITPSLDQLVIKSALQGLQTTIFTALFAWSISIINAIFFGIICSNLFSSIFEIPKFYTNIIKYFLILPRSIHEVIWGLLLLQLFGLNPWVAIFAIAIPYSSLMSRVICDQINTLNEKEFIAIKDSGANPLEVLIIILIPKILPIIWVYGFYRLECALRGATMLGVFGLGGIGTELKLSIQSLQFNEMWTSLWLLALIMIILEKSVEYMQQRKISKNGNDKYLIFTVFIILGSSLVSFFALRYINNDFAVPISFHPIAMPSVNSIVLSFRTLPMFNLIGETLVLTILAAGIAIGTPPILLILCRAKLLEELITYGWLFFRLIPAPLSALLILFCTTPGISVASLALGLYNMGVMGRLLKENINKNTDVFYHGFFAAGASERAAWLYGKLSSQTNSYLAYSAYRSDVILRETAVMGLVGGSGLGWQLQESLSSFNWSEVFVISAMFTLLTIIGETSSYTMQRQWQSRLNINQGFHLKAVSQ
ncbi:MULTISPECIES: PhnE/PtxC family ABC transporter permease [Prochlorococcus]|uniref:PhnE/PtxC family ABC transporter permease n=1 Tax=Prochlorococcus TaxID=1218 RepID=UPI000533BA63|nr:MULTISPECIES: ABC transporter permease subunit [Prochlorococcus]KGG12559.1 Phosphonate ABC transporter permease protein phnE [Prochlorococcus sp. MIT 0601]